MDPVSALSLAASVIAVVQISKEAIDIYSDLLETGSVSQYEATEAAARSLESSIKDLREPLKDAAGSAQTHGDKYLVDLANKSTAIANDLQGVIEKLRRDPNGGIFDAIRKTYRAITKRKDIERKKKDLDEYEKALNTLILVQLRQGTSKSSQRYGEVLQKLSDLKVVIEGSNVGVAQADSDQSNLFALTSKFLDSLLFTDIYSRHEQITSAHKKTFGWIFNGFEGLNLEQPRKWANFVAWLERCDSSENMYWIQGKAGSGKSTLMSYLADHQKTHAALHVWCGKDSILLTPCFFFWNTGSILQKSVRGLLRSIIYQLLRGSKVLLTTLVAQSNQASPQILPIDYQMAWTEQRLFDLLDRILEMSEALGIYICFFLDGLDEYTGETDHLTKWILEVSTQSNVKICVSSRPEEAYRQAFLHKPQLRLQDLTHDDIALYIRDRLSGPLITSSSHQSCEFSRCCQRFTHDGCPYSLMDAVQQRASGVFLWVKLVVSDLLNGVTARETISQLQERLEEIPTEIQDLYAHMLKKLPKRFSSPGIRYLSMMLAASEFHGALQPECVKDLSVLDVAMADDIFWRKIIRYDLSSSVEQELDEYCDRLESHILCCCAGLVEFRGMRAAPGLLRHHLSTLDFIHRSVNEFLLSDASLLPPTAIAEAFVSFTRAKIGFCAWYFAGPLRYFAGSLRDAFPQVDYTERNSLLEDSLSLRQFATRGRSEVEGIESEMIGMALMLERKFSEDKEYESSVYNAFEDTSFHLFVFLKKCDRSLWNMQDSWTRERLGVSIDAKDDDSLCHLARLGFRSAVSYIQDCSPASTSYFDTIVDCILSSPGLEDEHIAVNQIQIAEAAFERGANCQRTVAITFLNGHEEMEIFLPCVQEAWAFLLWRATFRVWRMQAQSDRITELILKYVEYCLDKGASLGTTCLIPIFEAPRSYGYEHYIIEDVVSRAYFVTAVSVLSIMHYAPNSPSKTRILEKAATCHTKPHRSVRYYVDPEQRLFHLADWQSNYVSEQHWPRNEPKSFGHFTFLHCFGSFRKHVISLCGGKGLIEDCIQETIAEATYLGSLKSGVIIGDESTYQTSNTKQGEHSEQLVESTSPSCQTHAAMQRGPRHSTMQLGLRRTGIEERSSSNPRNMPPALHVSPQIGSYNAILNIRLPP